MMARPLDRPYLMAAAPHCAADVVPNKRMPALNTYPYCEFEGLSEKLKTMAPFAYLEPESEDDEDEDFPDKWRDIAGGFPCPSLEPGDEIGVVEHSDIALSNSHDVPSLKLVNMHSMPQDLVQAYLSQISEPHLDRTFIENCVKKSNLVLFALDREKSGLEGVLGVIVADVSDLQAPMIEHNAKLADLTINFEFVHVKNDARGFGVGTTLAAALGYDLGLSLKELLTDNFSVLKSLDQINVQIVYESEFAPGERAATALQSGFEFMMESLPDEAFELAVEHGEQGDVRSMMRMAPSVSIEQLNEH